MCGVVGISFRWGVHARKQRMKDIKEGFTKMLVAAQERGSAATGIVVVSREKEGSKPKINVLRSPLPAKQFVESEEYKNIMGQVNNHCLSILGHTRAVSGNNATARDNRNNHPHIHEPIISIHNGRILNDYSLWQKYKDKIQRQGDCDSEIISALVKQKLNSGAATTEDAIAAALREIKGWFALAVINAKEPEKVYILRDETMPLEVIWWPMPEITIFSSEYSYMEKGFKLNSLMNNGIASRPKRLELKRMQLVALNSTIKPAKYEDHYVGVKQLEIDEAEKKKIVSQHEEDFAATQGQ